MVITIDHRDVITKRQQPYWPTFIQYWSYPMYRTLSLAALAVVIASPAMAAGATCSTAAADKFQPEATLKAQLLKEGLTVRKIKTEKGCYEVYAVDKSGKKVNVAYNAETLDKVDNAEAGEN
jgi:hypothetical protein